MFNDYPKSEYELQRERNIREREALFAEMEKAEAAEFADVAEAINALKYYSESLKQSKPKPTPKRKRTPKRDSSVPQERRRSSRLAKQDPELNYVELPEGSIRTYEYNSDEKRNTKRVKPKPTVDLSGPLRSREITEQDFENIATRTIEKIYSSSGTTCHQCRQKTLDTKSFCRNPECVGVHGQVCGPCLRNRYGEDLAETLKNPAWICPYCRNECNCSFCRTREGKSPTGIMSPIAFTRGFKSVSHLLAYEENDTEEITNDVSDEEENNGTDSEQSAGNSKINKKEPAHKPVSPEEQRQKKSKQEEKDLLGFTNKGDSAHKPVSPEEQRQKKSKQEEKDLLGFTDKGDYKFSC